MGNTAPGAMMILWLMTCVLYGLSALLYLADLGSSDRGSARAARAALIGALLLHLGLIGSLCIQQQNPLRDLRGALGFIAWLLGAGYLVTTHRTRMSVLGAFVVPLALSLLVISGITPGSVGGEASADRVLGELHIALAALGAACFGLAAAVALLYLIQERALKRKKLGPLFRLTPPLAVLDRVGSRLILVGFPLFTLALVTGLVWAGRALGSYNLHLVYIVSTATWLVFAVQIGLRWRRGLRGRQAALLTVAGFVATVAILLVYLARRVWGA